MILCLLLRHLCQHLCLDFLCLRITVECEALNKHPGKSHLYGRSPVCVRLCCLISLDVPVRVTQPGHSHTYGFSPVCMRRCFLRSLDPDDSK